MAEQVKDTERAQATVRLLSALLVTVYAPALAWAGQLPMERAALLAAHGMAFLIISLLLRWAIIRWPGNYPARRVFAMVNDYSALGFHLALGGRALLPVYAVVLWMTVGYGVRYGSRYLVAATALALLDLAVVAYLTPYWHEQPYVTVTLILAALIVPAYTHFLLRSNEKSYAREREATLAKTRFLAQASHDLRQPIHSIALFADCLRDENLNGHQRHLVDSIDRSLNSVSHLFRSILDSYTLDSGKLEPKPQAVRMREVLETVVRDFREVASPWAEVPVRVNAGDYRVRTDPNLLSTVVQNLLSNAVKYGGGREVLIAVRRRGTTLSLQVHDRGRGIPEAHLGMVFEEFYRVRLQRDKDIEGLGLGLSIVKRLCTLLGLRVSIRSRSGQGTTVTVDGFPLLEDAPPEETRRTAAGASRLNGLRVLLIEDDENVLMATAMLLERWGCVVEQASALPEAPPDCDVVISDYDLNAEMTGAECIVRVRSLLGANVPAMLLTGHDTKAIREAVDDPALPILAKPIRAAELRSLLTTLALAAEPRNRVPEPVPGA
ncbi:hybrid sensor histidine kinase/response regulator [Achromobacter pestifer]|uniref:histidine kinase n=1 Tax=Achromobacter pestifer TaxID=1353889 RepID=A0A6S6Z4E4_9BURK|nr:hybrid sensor histidine kinase/response regulator [Achromobacter pestifer]CAB3657036.1 Sensory/regulatory protein RpfC [Achromobacter pestifer]